MSEPSVRFDIDGVSISPDHYINGVRVASEATFEDRSPLDWSRVLGHIARGSTETADAALSAAHAAFPAWAALSCEARGEYLHRLAELIDERVEEIARVECVDMAMLEESLSGTPQLDRGLYTLLAHMQSEAGRSEEALDTLRGDDLMAERFPVPGFRPIQDAHIVKSRFDSFAKKPTTPTRRVGGENPVDRRDIETTARQMREG